jgi:hypothetical protein
MTPAPPVPNPFTPPPIPSPAEGAAGYRRARNILLALAIILPAALLVLFERQARRLDALADHGRPVLAYVTGIDEKNGTTFYAYRVDGRNHEWNCARNEAPFALHQWFAATYLPEVQTFSRPISDRSVAAREAAGNRKFTGWFTLGLAAFLLLFAWTSHYEMRCRLTNAPPMSLRARMIVILLIMAPATAGIAWFHIQDARKRHESIVPVIVGLALAVIIAVTAGLVSYRRTKQWLGGPLSHR